MSESNEYKECPYCAEKIKSKAIKCKHCQSMLTESSRVLSDSNKGLESDDNRSTTNNAETDTSKIINITESTNVPKDYRSHFAIASLVMGVLGILLIFILYLSSIIQGIGVVLGILGYKSYRKGFAIAGIVVCYLGLSGTLISISSNFPELGSILLLALLLSIIGLINGIKYLKSKKRWLAIAATVICSIGLTLSLVFIISMVILEDFNSREADRLRREIAEIEKEISALERSIDAAEQIQRQTINPVRISNVRLSKNSSYAIAEGSVTNIIDSEIRFVQLKGLFEDSSGIVIDTTSTYAVGGEGLSPGQSSTFRMSVPNNISIRSVSVDLLSFD